MHRTASTTFNGISRRDRNELPLVGNVGHPVNDAMKTFEAGDPELAEFIKKHIQILRSHYDDP